MPRQPKGRPVTWIELAVRRGGFRKALKALMWANQWAVVREELGHDPSADEVADWWKAPRRSAFREQAAFRECFPMLETPAPIFESPEARAALLKSIEAGKALEAAVRSTRSRAPLSDTSLLQIGMSPASVPG